MDTIHVTEYGAFLGKHSERLVIRKGKETLSEHPLMDVEQVMVESRGGSVSWDLVHECCQRGIPITLLGRGGMPVARLSSPSLGATVKTRREQLSAFLDGRGVAVARAIGRGKLRNQANTLRYFAKYRKSSEAGVFDLVEKEAAAIRELEKAVGELDAVNVDELRPTLLNLEGRAGACYWRGVAALLGDKAPLDRREHRGTACPTNAMFNYGYGILQSQAWTAITLAGLEPFAGFLHVDRPGRPSLVLDFMEEFRQPVVDRALIAAIGKGMQVKLEEEPTEPASADAGSTGTASPEATPSPATSPGAAPVEAASGNGDATEAGSAPARFLCTESKRAVADRVLERLDSREAYRDMKQTLRNVIQMQARRLAVSLRGEADYEPFVISW